MGRWSDIAGTGYSRRGRKTALPGWCVMSAEARASIIVFLILLVAGLGLFFGSRYASNSSRADTADANVLMQAKVIQQQATESQAFSALASGTVDANAAVDARAETTVIEYREILRREKTCDYPVPAYVADGLLNYTNSLRAGAMHTATAGTDKAGSASTPSSQLTYCQAVLWIEPLLAAIEKANNQLAAIRQAEQLRQGKRNDVIRNTIAVLLRHHQCVSAHRWWLGKNP
jgi:hypothetical protein